MIDIKNKIATTNNSKPKFSVALQSDAYKKLINNTLQDPKRASRFIASISSAVATNPDLQKCDAGTILSGALLGESLGLSPSAQLGQFYLVPFNDKERGSVATFQLGYKGFVQLALRSGYYKKLNVIAIKEGELKNYDPLEETIDVELIEDDEKREEAETIGYYAFFEYLNGFKKSMYWSKKKMMAHAKKYSAGYRKDLDKGTQYTFWSKDFDGMAFKTMLRQLISKWGIMSIEMQEAYTKDTTIMNTDGTYNYFDNEDNGVVEEVPTQVEPTESKLDSNTDKTVYDEEGNALYRMN